MDTFSLECRMRKPSPRAADREFRLIHDCETLLTGRARGRLLAGGAEFHNPEGSLAFTIEPNRRILPSTWVVATPAGVPSLTFRMSGVRRGRTMVKDHTTDTTQLFAPKATRGGDMARALVLVDTSTFTISDGDHVLALVGSGQPLDPEFSLLRGVLANAVLTVRSAGPGFHPAAWLSLVDDTWRPRAEMVAAYLLIRHQVVDHVRSP